MDGLKFTQKERPTGNKGWIEFALWILFKETNWYGEIIENAMNETTAMRDDKLKLEIAARDFLRATNMYNQITQQEFYDARNALAAMVMKGDE